MTQLINQYFNDVMINIDTFNYRKAAYILNKVVDMDPEWFDAQFQLGYSYHNIDDIDNAKKHLEKALTIKPAHQEVIEELAELYEKAGDYENSLVMYRKLKPSDKINNNLTRVEAKYESNNHLDILHADYVTKHNDDDVIYYAFITDIFTGVMADTILLFERGDDLDKKILVGLAFSGKRYIKSTLDKDKLHSFWLKGSKQHRLREYYITPENKLALTIELDSSHRINNQETGMLEYGHTFSFYNVVIDKDVSCFTLIEDKQKNQPECFELIK